jgi:hypothetical protein
MMDGEVMRRLMGNFLRGKKFMFVLVGPGVGGGLVRAMASLTMVSATDPGATLDDRRVVGLQMGVVRPGDGGGLEGVTTLLLLLLLLVIIIEDVE